MHAFRFYLRRSGAIFREPSYREEHIAICQDGMKEHLGARIEDNMVLEFIMDPPISPEGAETLGWHYFNIQCLYPNAVLRNRWGHTPWILNTTINRVCEAMHIHKKGLLGRSLIARAFPEGSIPLADFEAL